MLVCQHVPASDLFLGKWLLAGGCKAPFKSKKTVKIKLRLSTGPFTGFTMGNLTNYAFVSLLAYWIHGYAFAFGDQERIIGNKNFFTFGNVNFSHFFFNYARCAIVTTIVSGAITQRTEPIGYIISSYILAGFVYPIVSRSFWHQSGLFYINLPVEDYAGSGVVFLVGGTAALIASFVTNAHVARCVTPIINQGYSLPLAVLGAFMQIIGSLGFVVGAQGHITESGDGQSASLAVVNTLLSTGSAGLYGLFFLRMRRDTYSMPRLINSALSGMVAVCGGANKYMPALAVMCGASASLLYMALEHLCTVAKIEDPNDTIANGGEPIASLQADWISTVTKPLRLPPFPFSSDVTGGCYLHPDASIEYNCLALCVVMVWTTFVMGFVYLLLKFVGILKPFPKMESQVILLLLMYE
ncbi:putative ammonium transporter 1 [Carcharodon carcharias]|uniref:putative ammonium transporter 1 n=1 Tax=Carcharodon carcharias TaxID=13397 RepID=UPI001B7DBA6C|nr:putative ammonium transporter 1 [Carcharodon carcharias]